MTPIVAHLHVELTHCGWASIIVSEVESQNSQPFLDITNAFHVLDSDEFPTYSSYHHRLYLITIMFSHSAFLSVVNLRMDSSNTPLLMAPFSAAVFCPCVINHLMMSTILVKSNKIMGLYVSETRPSKNHNLSATFRLSLNEQFPSKDRTDIELN